MGRQLGGLICPGVSLGGQPAAASSRGVATAWSSSLSLIRRTPICGHLKVEFIYCFYGLLLPFHFLLIWVLSSSCLFLSCSFSLCLSI